jgi:hypothetical protein
MLLTLVQTAHTLITYINFAALFVMIYMHWTNKRNKWLYISYWLIGIEVIAMLAFKFTCPLRYWVTRHYSSSTPDQIILNDIAPYYLHAGSTLLGIAVLTFFFRRK